MHKKHSNCTHKLKTARDFVIFVVKPAKQSTVRYYSVKFEIVSS